MGNASRMHACAENSLCEPVQQLISPPLVGGDKGEGETMKLKNMLHLLLLLPHLYPPLEGLPSPIEGEGSLMLSDKL